VDNFVEGGIQMGIEYVNENYQMQIKPLVQRSAKYFSGKEGVYSPDHNGKIFRSTWGDVYTRLCRLANTLEKLGVRRGDRVGTLAWNTHRHLELSFATPMMGAVFHPSNFRYSRDHLLHVINHAKDKIIFVDEDLIPFLENVKDELDTVESYVILTPKEKLPNTKLSPVYSYEELLQQAPIEYDFPDDIPENALSILCYTGGTTGLPKGVGFSPRSIVLYCLGLQQPDLAEIHEDDRVLSAVPLFHVNSHHFYLIGAMTGSKVVLPGPHPTPADQLKVMAEESVTIYLGAFVAVMFAIQEWEKGEYDLSSLKKVIGGATAAPRTVVEALDRKGLKCFFGYGLAESRVVCVTLSSHLEHMERWTKEKYFDKMTQAGLPMPGTEMRVISLDTGKEVAWDGKEAGEVLLKGLWVGQEYYNDIEGTKKVFTDGWLNTGDVGVIDEDGYLRMMDRVKDMIKSGGEWISSVDLENAIMNNPEVTQAAVFGIPDPKWQERPAAAIILKDEYKGEVTRENILNPLRSKFAKWALPVPEHIIFVDELPMTGTMKVMKRVLREMWKEGKLATK
jgi:fatty-acyl-CoA synthase